MKTNLHLKLILIGTFFISLVAKSQSDNTGYAVTDSISNGMKWNFLRTVNIQTGVYSDTLMRLLTNSELLPNNGIIPCNGVAAIAHDKRNKRLYFTSMLLDKLNYVDLRTMTVHVAINNFTGQMPKQPDQSNIFTRMVIADDANGYALTNDGNHIIRFTAGNNHVATDLGSLTDAPGNNENSIHNACSSWGGDMVSDDEGNLYLVTFRNHVFKINIQSRIATYLGTVTGLPTNFSTSGVAVDQQGSSCRLIIASSVDASNVYALNLNTLTVTGLNFNSAKHSSDLSNSTVIKTKKQSVNSKMIVSSKITNHRIQVYPNPVPADEFKIQFTDTEAGLYTVEFVDAKGQVVTTKKISLTGKNSLIEMNLTGIVAKGIFILRVVGKNKRTVFSEKIILQ